VRYLGLARNALYTLCPDLNTAVSCELGDLTPHSGRYYYPLRLLTDRVERSTPRLPRRAMTSRRIPVAEVDGNLLGERQVLASMCLAKPLPSRGLRNQPLFMLSGGLWLVAVPVGAPAFVAQGPRPYAFGLP
jgi:hypothetical protein